MKTRFLSSFARDLRKIRTPSIHEQVRAAILAVEEASDLHSVPNLRKLSSGGPYYRIRIGNHRIGVRVDGDTVLFVRVLPRRDIYRYFP